MSECSTCGSEMRKGYIQSSNLPWVPKVAKFSVEPSLNEGSVLLSNQNRFTINYVESEECKRLF